MRLTTDPVTQLLQFCPNAVSMSALDFQIGFNNGPSGPTGIFESGQQLREVIYGGVQVPHDGHHPPMLAFFHTHTNALMTSDSPLGFRRRALALGFWFLAAFAMGWAVKNGSGKKSHGVVTGLFWGMQRFCMEQQLWPLLCEFLNGLGQVTVGDAKDTAAFVQPILNVIADVF